MENFVLEQAWVCCSSEELNLTSCRGAYQLPGKIEPTVDGVRSEPRDNPIEAREALLTRVCVASKGAHKFLL